MSMCVFSRTGVNGMASFASSQTTHTQPTVMMGEQINEGKKRKKKNRNCIDKSYIRIADCLASQHSIGAVMQAACMHMQ